MTHRRTFIDPPSHIPLAGRVDRALLRGLSEEELEDRRQAAARRIEFAEREFAFYLADMDARGVHRDLGFASTVAFAERRLDMPRERTLELIAVGRALETLPLIDAAFFAGEIRWERVRRLALFVRPPVEAVWLEVAKTYDVDRFEALLSDEVPPCCGPARPASGPSKTNTDGPR
jgi:hypothetical protein